MPRAYSWMRGTSWASHPTYPPAEDPPPRGPPGLRPRLALPLKRGIAPGIPRADRRPRGRRRRREFYCPSEKTTVRRDEVPASRALSRPRFPASASTQAKQLCSHVWNLKHHAPRLLSLDDDPPARAPSHPALTTAPSALRSHAPSSSPPLNLNPPSRPRAPLVRPRPRRVPARVPVPPPPPPPPPARVAPALSTRGSATKPPTRPKPPTPRPPTARETARDRLPTRGSRASARRTFRSART